MKPSRVVRRLHDLIVNDIVAYVKGEGLRRFSVLDVGCGGLDIFLGLRKKKLNFDYVGVSSDEVVCKRCRDAGMVVFYDDIESFFKRYDGMFKFNVVLINGSEVDGWGLRRVANFLNLLAGVMSKKGIVYSVLRNDSRKIKFKTFKEGLFKRKEYIGLCIII